MNKTVNIMGNVDVNKLKNQIKEDLQNLSDESNTDNNTSTNENIGNCQVDLIGILKRNNVITETPSGEIRLDMKQFLNIGVDKDKMKDELGV